MTPTHMYSNECPDALERARSTVDYLLEDVVRLKGRIVELETENTQLRRRINDVVTNGPTPSTFKPVKHTKHQTTY